MNASPTQSADPIHPIRNTTSEIEQDWSEPGFTLPQSRFRNILRVLKQLIRPLKGDKTLPTSVGLILIGLSLAIGIAAYNTSSNILFMTLSLLLSCLILSGVLAWMNLHGTRWKLAVAPRIRAGQSTSLSVDMVNTKTILPTYSLCFELKVLHADKSHQMCQQEGLDPGERTRLVWRYTPSRHGSETIAITRLESLYPFGFLRKILSGWQRQDIIIWPKRTRYSFQPPYGSQWRHQGKTILMSGHGPELINLRHYRPGDAMRTVHWKASARVRRLLVRETSEERQDAYMILLETPDSLWTDEVQFETLSRLAVSISEDLYTRGQLSAVAINDESARPVRRINDLHGFWDRASTVEKTDHYTPIVNLQGATIITFAPGKDAQVDIYVGSHHAGTTQVDHD